MNINELLNEYIDDDYKKFVTKICPTNYEVLGIKIPVLRKLSKTLVKEFDYKDILNNLNYHYFEHLLLYILITSKINNTYLDKIHNIDTILPLIDNWEACDLLVIESKFIQENKDEFFSYLELISSNNKEFYERFIYVVYLYYYIDDDYIDIILHKIKLFNSSSYYALMASSWCLSVCLINYFAKTTKFMQDNKGEFNAFVYNKALQKGIDSHKLKAYEKNVLRSMKIKEV